MLDDLLLGSRVLLTVVLIFLHVLHLEITFLAFCSPPFWRIYFQLLLRLFLLMAISLPLMCNPLLLGPFFCVFNAISFIKKYIYNII